MFKTIENEDKTKYDNFYASSKAEININESDIDDVFQSICTIIILNIKIFFGKGSRWMNESAIDYIINIFQIIIP